MDDIDRMVKSMTLDELRAARELLDDQLYGEKFADAKGGVALTPIEEERRRSMRSTFEGGSNPDLSARYGWALPALSAKISNLFNSGDARKIASAYVLTKSYDRISTGCTACDLHEAHEDDCTNPAHNEGVVGI